MRNRKLTSVLLLALATFFVVSCSKQAPPLEEPDQFMDVITGVATHISCCSAEIAGKAIVPKNMSTGVTLGISYFTEDEPIQVEADFFDPEYNYSVNIGSLEPETTYYYFSYLNHLGNIFHGEVKSFKTLAVSSLIQTLDATEINQTEAVLNAFLDLTNCIYDSLEYGFEVTLDGGGTHILKSDNYSGKKFSVKDEFLSRYTKYSVVAYVKLDGHTYKGETKSFTTMPVTATVTAEASDVSYHSATISGKLTIESEESFTTSAKLYYSNTASTLEALKLNGMPKTLTLDSDGAYSVNLSFLDSGNKYYYAVVAMVDEAESDSELKSFNTLQIVASITAEASDVSYHSATISGKLTIESEESFTTSAKLYYSNTASTLEALKSSGMKKTCTFGSDGTFSIIVDWLSINENYYYCVVAKVGDKEFSSSVKSFTTKEFVFAAVDLGLSVKWANANLGASSPQDYGGYYQWAGTEDVSDKSINLYWDYCPYHTGSSYEFGWTKYNTKSRYGTVDNMTKFGASDDAATVNLGGEWRMPTHAEWKELLNNCRWTWTTLGGVKGYKVQSMMTGYTDKWIFLPAAGCRFDDVLYEVGAYGYYWSSSLDTDYPYFAYGVYFNSGDVVRRSNPRYEGRSVRPVSE